MADFPLTYTDVCQDDVELLEREERSPSTTSRKPVLRQILAKCLKVAVEEEGVAAEVLLEFHLQNYFFCRKSSTLSRPEKISTLLSLMRIVYEASIPTALPIADSLKLLRMHLERHGTQNPPFAVAVFTPDERASICDYASQTFYRHYTMYQYVYKKRRELDVQVLADDIAPPMTTLVTGFRKSDEVDPRMQPELEGYFNKKQPVDWSATSSGYSTQKAGTKVSAAELDADTKLTDAFGAFDAAIKASDEKLEALLGGVQ